MPPMPPPNLRLELSDTQAILRVDPEVVRSVALHVMAVEGVAEADLSVAIVDDDTIRAVNRRHLGHDWPTDVISFPTDAPAAGVLDGEVVVSAETALGAASTLGSDPIEEVVLYLVHGLLHLRGFDDRDDVSRARMRHREDELIAGLGLGPIARREGSGTSVEPRLEAHP